MRRLLSHETYSTEQALNLDRFRWVGRGVRIPTNDVPARYLFESRSILTDKSEVLGKTTFTDMAGSLGGIR